MRTPKRISGILIVLLAALGIAGPAGHAQAPGSSEAPIQRDRLHLRAADWGERAKTQSGVQVGRAVRLKEGASEGRITSARIKLPFPVNAVGTHWSAQLPDATTLDVELRASTDGRNWTSWIAPVHHRPIPATTEADGEQNVYAGDISGGLILTEPDTRYVQVRLTLRGTEEITPALRRLSLYLVNSTDGPPVPSDVPNRTAPKGIGADTTEPRIYARDEWGARAPTAEYRYHPVTHLAIHHTATASAGAADTWEDCAAAVRAIQDYHMDTNGWIDIGYNYLVCQTGAIFQGREDGDHSRDVVGAHDGYNDGSAGTAALGYFHPPENQQPTEVLIDSYVDLFGWIAERRSIDPDGTSNYYQYGPLRNVYGHRDVKATACPGDHLYPERSALVDRLGEIVSDTSDETDPPSETILSESYPNPAPSQARFDLQLSRGGVVTVTVYDLLGRRVARRRYGYHDPGTHTVSLRTAGWAAGTYFYRLRVDETISTGTLRVVR
jgi:hypothetical protein